VVEAFSPNMDLKVSNTSGGGRVSNIDFFGESKAAFAAETQAHATGFCPNPKEADTATTTHPHQRPRRRTPQPTPTPM